MAGESPPPSEWHPLDGDFDARPLAPQEHQMDGLLASTPEKEERDSMSDEPSKITLNDLIRRRRELMFDIGEAEKALAQKRDVLFHISETIKAIDPRIRLDA